MEEDIALANSTGRYLQSNEPIRRRRNKVPVKKIVDIIVESSFYEEESEETRILDYYATEVKSTAIDI